MGAYFLIPKNIIPVLVPKEDKLKNDLVLEVSAVEKWIGHDRMHS